LINIFGLRLSLREPSAMWTFGYERVEIIAAIISILLIVLLTVGLCWEAGNRIANPPNVDGKIMIIVASFGIATNILLGCILSQSGHGHSHFGASRERANHENQVVSSASSHDRHSHGDGGHHSHGDDHSISVQSAYVHALGDLLQNIGVLIAGIMIAIDPEKFKIMDPICTFCFAILVFIITIPLIYRAFYVLMETVPKNLNTKEMASEIAKIEHVQAIRDFHVWSVGYTQTVLTAKLDILEEESKEVASSSDCHCAMQAAVRGKVERIALDKGIKHCNLDILVVSCKDNQGRRSSSEILDIE